MSEDLKTEIRKIVEETLKLTTQRIGTGILKFELNGKPVHQSFEMLEYYKKHNCLKTYLLELN